MEILDTSCWVLTEGQKRKYEPKTKLQVLSTYVDDEEVYMLILGKFKTVLRAHVPCLEMAPRNFVFPTDGDCYGIIIDE